MEIKYVFNENGPSLKEIIESFLTLYKIENQNSTEENEK